MSAPDTRLPKPIRRACSQPTNAEVQAIRIIVTGCAARFLPRHIHDRTQNAKRLGGRRDVTEDGAVPHIDSLAKKYLGQDKYPNAALGEVRLMREIEPTSVSGMG
jgi:hypothetical protein